MNLERALRVLLRRWLVVVIGAALSLGAAVYLYTSTAPTYIASARLLLLLPPGAEDEETDSSPFLYLPNGLDILARVVASGPQSSASALGFEAQGLVSAFEVDVDPASPIIIVEVQGEDPANVIATRDAVVQALQAELERVQEEEEVPARQEASARVFAAEDTPTALSGDRRRNTLAVVAAGGLLTLLAAFGVDWLANGRTSRSLRHRGERQGSPGPSGAQTAGASHQLVGGTDGRG